MPSKLAYDLEKLEKLLKSDRRYNLVSRLLTQFASACSIWRDLQSSRKSLETLSSIEGDADARELFGQALFMHAVITYSRATISRTNARSTIDVTKAFTKEQNAMHRDIADLRNTALAHYHHGEGGHGHDWVTHKAIIRELDGVLGGPADVFRRRNFTKKAVEDLVELLDASLDHVESEHHQRAVRLRDEIVRLRREDPIFDRSFGSCNFEPRDFFNDDNMADGFWHDIEFSRELYAVP